MLAKDIMTKEVITVGPETGIEEVVRTITEKGISGLPVVDEEKRILGIVSEGDLLVRSKELHFPTYLQFLSGVFYLESLHKFEEEIKKAAAAKVQEIMTTPVITALPETDVETLATLMVEKRVNRIPIVQEKILVGIVTRADIIRAQQKK